MKLSSMKCLRTNGIELTSMKRLRLNGIGQEVVSTQNKAD